MQKKNWRRRGFVLRVVGPMVALALVLTGCGAVGAIDSGVEEAGIDTITVSDITLDERAEEETEMSFLTMNGDNEENFSVTEASYIGYCTASYLNVRSGPGTGYEAVGSLSYSQVVNVTGACGNGWLRINYNGEDAYCSGRYVASAMISTKSELLAAETEIVKSSTGIAEGKDGAGIEWVDKINESLSYVPQKILDSFQVDGWHIYATTLDLDDYYFDGAVGSIRGVTNYTAKTIEIECRDSAVTYAPAHEMGHYVDWKLGWPSSTEEFLKIYNEEVEEFKSGIENSGCVTGPGEMFAEGFYYYCTDQTKLTPKLKDFLEEQVNSF